MVDIKETITGFRREARNIESLIDRIRVDMGRIGEAKETDWKRPTEGRK